MLPPLLLALFLSSLAALDSIDGRIYAENSNERQALDMGIRNKEADSSTRPRDFLCATFTSLDLFAQGIIHDNANSLVQCDWAIIVFDNQNVTDEDQSKRFVSLCDKDKFMFNGRNRLVHCGFLNITDDEIKQMMRTYNVSETESYFNLVNIRRSETFLKSFLRLNRVIKKMKPIMYMELLPYLRYYKRVLTFDNDISFLKFDFDYAMQLWDCSFHPSPPPLIVQPLLFNKGCSFMFSDCYYYWRGQGQREKPVKSVPLDAFGYPVHPTRPSRHPLRIRTRRSRPGHMSSDYPSQHIPSSDTPSPGKLLMHSTRYIEQQVPFFDAGFFEWLIRRVLPFTARFHYMYQNDWGLDTIWCNAARAYAAEVLGWTDYNVSCAILLDSSPVMHMDTHSMEKSVDFNERGSHILQLYHRLFPHWSFETHSRAPIQLWSLIEQGEEPTKVTRLNYSCRAKM